MPDCEGVLESVYARLRRSSCRFTRHFVQKDLQLYMPVCEKVLSGVQCTCQFVFKCLQVYMPLCVEVLAGVYASLCKCAGRCT